LRSKWNIERCHRCIERSGSRPETRVHRDEQCASPVTIGKEASTHDASSRYTESLEPLRLPSHTCKRSRRGGSAGQSDKASRPLIYRETSRYDRQHRLAGLPRTPPCSDI